MIAKSLNDVQMQMKCEYGEQYSHIIEHDIKHKQSNKHTNIHFFQQKIQLP